MSKITAEMAMEWYANSLIEAIGNCLSLSDEFLYKYCNNEFIELMKDIPERDREYIISGIDCEWQFNGFPPSNEWQHIWLNVSEIEEQFEGDPGDVFENVDDWYIDGDLAYLYVGYGLSITFNDAELRQAIADYQE